MSILESSGTVTLSVLRQRLGLGWGTLYHHIERMRARGEINTTIVGRRHLVFRGVTVGADAEVRAVGLLRGQSAQRLARAIVSAPRRSVAELSRELGISERVIYYHVRRLIEAGLLVSEPGRRQLDLRPTTLLLRLLAGSTNPPSA